MMSSPISLVERSRSGESMTKALGLVDDGFELGGGDGALFAGAQAGR